VLHAWGDTSTQNLTTVFNQINLLLNVFINAEQC